MSEITFYAVYEAVRAEFAQLQLLIEDNQLHIGGIFSNFGTAESSRSQA
jgi:hypothetical protein